MKPVEELRSAVDIVKIVGASVKLRKSGANFIGLCPFHQEKTPSFAVHPTKQIFHCFGCGVGGDVFKFVMLLDNVTFPEAVERVAEAAGVRLPDGWSQGRDSARSQERSILLKMHEAAAQFYASQLGATAEGRAAIAYLEDRGVKGQTLADFHLGYAPAEGGALARRLGERGFSPEQMETAGLVVPARDGRRPLDRFRRRIIFPIAGEDGKAIAFAGRSLGDEQPKYLNSPETPIYTKSRVLYHLHRAGPEIRKHDCAILVEGYMDCIALASAGVMNVVASCGTSLTVNQIRVLGRSTRRVVVNFDPDSAGAAATERSLGMLLEEGFEVRVLRLPGGLDPDSFIRQRGAETYKSLLAGAPAYLDYLSDRAVAANDVTTPEGKVRAANAVLPYLAKVSNPLLRDEMAVRLAEQLRLDAQLLRGELRRAARTGAREIAAQPEDTAPAVGIAEKELARAFIADPELAGEFLGPLLQEDLCGGLPSAALFRNLLAEYSMGGCLDFHRFSDSLAAAEQKLLFELQFEAGPAPNRERVVSCLDALRRRKMEHERAALQSAIERAEKERDAPTLARLMEAKLQMARRLAQARHG